MAEETLPPPPPVPQPIPRVAPAAIWSLVLAVLNKPAVLQDGDKSKQMYFIVITDDKAELDNFTLKKHHQLTSDRMLQKMKNASATESVRLTIDGHPAFQDELSGSENRTNVI